MNVDNDQLDVNLLVDEESGLDRVEKLRRRTDQWFGKVGLNWVGSGASIFA